jgi:site-specific recombinase XerC
MGKGNKRHIRGISGKMYLELLKIRELDYYKRYNNDLIFHLSSTTIQSMMEALRVEMGFSEDRWITFHSTRNTMPNHILESSEDLISAQEQLGHSSMDTTYKKYISKKRNYGSMASVRIDEEIDNSIFDELTHEQLLEMVKGMKNGIGYALREEASKILNK